MLICSWSLRVPQQFLTLLPQARICQCGFSALFNSASCEKKNLSFEALWMDEWDEKGKNIPFWDMQRSRRQKVFAEEFTTFKLLVANFNVGHCLLMSSCEMMITSWYPFAAEKKNSSWTAAITITQQPRTELRQIIFLLTEFDVSFDSG